MKTKTKLSNKIQTLTLNKAMVPVNVIPWEKSIAAVIDGRARVIEYYDHVVIRTGYNRKHQDTREYRVPSVIQYPDAPMDDRHFIKTLKPTKENLFRREGGKCCYCRCRLDLDSATIEHVYPQCEGGLDDWINCRIACHSCNHKKGHKLLSELGWKLPEVGIPTVNGDIAKSIISKLNGRVLDESWRPYINWEVDWK